jgi:16S rRNA processing protein RimM
VAGEVVVEPLTDDPDRFYRLSKVILETDERQELQVRSVRRRQARTLIRFNGIENRNQAQSLVGGWLSVSKSELVQLPEDTFFHFELIGMEVYRDNGEYIGSIKEVWTMPANDVWVVAAEREILIPAVRQIVRVVDRRAGRVTIRAIEGLLEE